MTRVRLRGSLYAALLLGPGVLLAQTFEVASIRQTDPALTGGSSSNVPLGPGNIYSPIHGRFSATGQLLFGYIAFAYKLSDGQLNSLRAQAPTWVLDDRFDIQANVENPAATKDDLRFMMRALLASRFHLAVHFETRQVPAYALVLARPGVTGPHLRPHPAGGDCPSTLPEPGRPEAPTPPEATAEGFPTTCGGIVLLPHHAPYRFSIGGRNVGLALLASSSTNWGDLGRPVVDQTGLTGTYDFLLEYTPDAGELAGSDAQGPSFTEALRQQLGLRLEPRRSDVQVLVLDHVDHLTEN